MRNSPEREMPAAAGPGAEALLGCMVGGLQTAMRLQLEAMSLTGRRLRAQLDAAERLSRCRSPQEAWSVTMRFWQGAAADAAAFVTTAAGLMNAAGAGAPQPGPAGRATRMPDPAEASAPRRGDDDVRPPARSHAA